MPLIDVRCKACEHITEVNRPLAMWPQTPPCPDCEGATEQIHLPPSSRWTPDPVVVFMAHDGTYRFPGDANGLSASNYAKQGFQRVEIRGAIEMRRFESKMNKVEYGKAQRQFEKRQEQREHREHEMRSELRRLMQNMSEHGKAVARAAMSISDGKPVKRPGDANFHNDAYSNYRGNRDESRDAVGRRRRD